MQTTFLRKIEKHSKQAAGKALKFIEPVATTPKLHDDVVKNRYSTHSQQRRCVLFSHRRSVRTISLVAMQPIRDDKK